MRAVLALAVLLLCAWAGNRRRAKLEARTEAVAAIAADMRRLRDVMELTPMPIAEAAQRLHCGVWRAFIENLQNRGARQAWEEARCLPGLSAFLRASCLGLRSYELPWSERLPG